VAQQVERSALGGKQASHWGAHGEGEFSRSKTLPVAAVSENLIPAGSEDLVENRQEDR
jgi:hypothetical protein